MKKKKPLMSRPRPPSKKRFGGSDLLIDTISCFFSIWPPVISGVNLGPHLRGASLSFKNERPFFTCVPCRRNAYIFSDSRFLQGCLRLIKPAGRGCAHFQNQFFAHEICRHILTTQGQHRYPTVRPWPLPSSGLRSGGPRTWFRTVVLLRALPTPAL